MLRVAALLLVYEVLLLCETYHPSYCLTEVVRMDDRVTSHLPQEDPIQMAPGDGDLGQPRLERGVPGLHVC